MSGSQTEAWMQDVNARCQAWCSGDTAGFQCPELLVARGVQHGRSLCLYAMPTWRPVKTYVGHEIRGNNWVVAHQIPGNTQDLNPGSATGG